MLVFLTECATVACDSKYPVTITSDMNETKIIITDNNNRVVYQRKTSSVDTLETNSGFFWKGFDDSLYALTSTLAF